VFLQQPGLLVKTPSPYGGGATDEAVEQGTWINADPIKGCVVCNIGESERSENIAERWYSDTLGSTIVWEVWSNGLYKSTLHRVVHRGGNYRYVRSCFGAR
jgi:isopenicillin N synthase-like dioxygenase